MKLGQESAVIAILVLGFFGSVLPQMIAADAPALNIPVGIVHENGRFNGQLSVSLAGTSNKAKIVWNGTIRNDSEHPIFRATFCINAFDASDQPIQPPDGECVLRVWGTNWPAGTPFNFKGKQDIKLGEGKTPIQAARFDIKPIEVFDHAPNLRHLNTRCPLVWPTAIRVFADKKFRPTVMDKDSFTATYAYDGGRVDGGAEKMLKAFTTANTRFMSGPLWKSFRVDAASLYLREDEPGTCTAEVKMSFAGFGKPMFGTYGWMVAESNFVFEKSLLDEIEKQAANASSSDLDKAISALPSAPPPAPASELEKPQLSITSEPSGAEIEINGEFSGNTPSTASLDPGAVTVTIKKQGYQIWQRTLKVNPGDKKTLQADLTVE